MLNTRSKLKINADSRWKPYTLVRDNIIERPAAPPNASIRTSATKADTEASGYEVPAPQEPGDDITMVDDKKHAPEATNSPGKEDILDRAKKSPALTLSGILRDDAAQRAEYKRVYLAKEEVRELKRQVRELEEKHAAKSAELVRSKKAHDEGQQKVLADLGIAGISEELLREFTMFCESWEERSLMYSFYHEEPGAPFHNLWRNSKVRSSEFWKVAIHRMNFCVKAIEQLHDGRVRWDCYKLVDHGIGTQDEFQKRRLSWGERYSKIYGLATEAACEGSDVAIELLVRLPDISACSRGGWLFGYEKNCNGCKIIRSTHNIDSPMSDGAKKSQVMVMVQTAKAYRSSVASQHGDSH